MSEEYGGSRDDRTVAMRTSDTVGVRVGDTERNEAATALGEHFAAGRLDSTELDERLKTAYAARTRNELEGLFADLPEPAPFRPIPPRSRDRGWQDGRADRDWADRGWADRDGAGRGWQGRRRGLPVPFALVPIALVLAFIAFTAVFHFPPFFLIPLFFLFSWGRRGWGGGYRGYGRGRRAWR